MALQGSRLALTRDGCARYVGWCS